MAKSKALPAVSERETFYVPRSKSGPCLLSLDPSSTACGWAVFHGPERLADFGVIRPKASSPALDRVDRIVEAVEALLDEAQPDECVIEISSGKTHGRIAKASGLSVLGNAQGAVRQAIRNRHLPVEAVSENEWTGGNRKADRARVVGILYPPYARFAASGGDPGFDAADAIGIGAWLFGKRRWAQLVARATDGKGGRE
jgi:Holliday junction resolvasome RuvABC endonuclease subunit